MQSGTIGGGGQWSIIICRRGVQRIRCRYHRRWMIDVKKSFLVGKLSVSNIATRWEKGGGGDRIGK